MNRLQLDPLLRGNYSREVRELARSYFPRVTPDDEALLSGVNLDFPGVNVYTRVRARYAPLVPGLHFWTDEGDVPDAEFQRGGALYSDMGQEFYPPALRIVLERLRDEYGNPPVYITDSGANFHDILQGDRVHDAKRSAYIEACLAEAARSLEEGFNLRGYLCWSVLDNFEWSLGYAKRLGIVFVDYKTQRRIVKDSGRRYSQIIRHHRDRRETPF